jgi:hypothetical protein
MRVGAVRIGETNSEFGHPLGLVAASRNVIDPRFGNGSHDHLNERSVPAHQSEQQSTAEEVRIPRLTGPQG